MLHNPLPFWKHVALGDDWALEAAAKTHKPEVRVVGTRPGRITGYASRRVGTLGLLIGTVYELERGGNLSASYNSYEVKRKNPERELVFWYRTEESLIDIKEKFRWGERTAAVKRFKAKIPISAPDVIAALLDEISPDAVRTAREDFMAEARRR